MFARLASLSLLALAAVTSAAPCESHSSIPEPTLPGGPTTTDVSPTVSVSISIGISDTQTPVSNTQTAAPTGINPGVPNFPIPSLPIISILSSILNPGPAPSNPNAPSWMPPSPTPTGATSAGVPPTPTAPGTDPSAPTQTGSTPGPSDGNGGGPTCSTGPVQCCNSLVAPSSAEGQGLLAGLVGIDVSNIQGALGVTCSPIDILGGAANSCKAQTVCCQDNAQGGVVSVGCVPVQL